MSGWVPVESHVGLITWYSDLEFNANIFSDFLSYTDILKFPVYHNYIVFSIL